MPVVSANYWNNIHGHVAEEAKQDDGKKEIFHVGNPFIESDYLSWKKIHLKI